MSHPSTPAAAVAVEHLDTWGQMGHLTPVQEEALKQFQEQVKTEDLDKAKFRVETHENVSLRFLRARQFHVANALLLLHECVKKKEDLKAAHWANSTPDDCANCNIDAMKKWYPHGAWGFDKFNRPILFELSGHVDVAAIYQMTTLEGCINYHWWTMEHSLNLMFDEAATRGPVIISTCAVLDLTGLSSSHASNAVLNHVKAMIAVDNVCYPETLGKMIVINAPWIAVGLWDMVKGWLDPRTQAKIEIVGSGTDIAKRLLEYIPPENLPVKYGGTGTEPNFHRDNSEFIWIARHSAVKKSVTVSAGKKLVVDCYVTDGDVSFEVYSSNAATPVTVFDPIVHATNKHSLHEVVGLGDIAKLTAAGSMQPLEKKEIKGHENKHPIRTTVEFLNTETGNKTFTMFWGNASRWSTRPLIYVVNVVDA